MDPSSAQHQPTQQPTPPLDSAGAKPWASGRVLSKAQRDRKREVDRISKAKRRRDNTESRDTVDHLKKQVEQLSLRLQTLEGVDLQRQEHQQRQVPDEKTTTQSQDSGSYDHAFHLAQLSSIEYTSTSIYTPVSAHAPNNSFTGGQYHSNLNQLQNVLSFDAREESSSQEAPQISTVNDSSAPKAPLLPGEIASTTPLSAESTSPPLVKDMFNMLVHEALSTVTPATRHLIVTDPVLTQDALIRSVLHGWASVLDFSSPANEAIAGYPVTLHRCPVLRTLSKLDGIIFSFSSISTRLISLRMIHLMLLYMASAIPISMIPPWFRPRPSQQRFPHDPVIDLLPWPGLRERAVLNPELIKQNHLWRSIVSLFSFNWPYDEELAIVQVPQDDSGVIGSAGQSPRVAHSQAVGQHSMSSSHSTMSRYKFADPYHAQMWDIRMWNISLEFFDDFPALFEDIVPKAYVAPTYVRPSGTATGLTGIGMFPSIDHRWDNIPHELQGASALRTRTKKRHKRTTSTTSSSSAATSYSSSLPSPATLTDGVGTASNLLVQHSAGVMRRVLSNLPLEKGNL